MTFLKTTTAGALCALCTTPALGQEVLDLDTITGRVDRFERLVDFETIDSLD